MKRVSSPLTLLYKVIIFSLLTLFLYPIIRLFSSNSLIDFVKSMIYSFDITYLIILIPFAIVVFIFYKFYKLKYVYMDSNNLYISSLFRKTIVPISKIKSITVDRSFNFTFYHIRFIEKNIFGSRIILTTGHTYSQLLLSSPEINELENRIKSK